MPIPCGFERDVGRYNQTAVRWKLIVSVCCSRECGVIGDGNFPSRVDRLASPYDATLLQVVDLYGIILHKNACAIFPHEFTLDENYLLYVTRIT